MRTPRMTRRRFVAGTAGDPGRPPGSTLHVSDHVTARPVGHTRSVARTRAPTQKHARAKAQLRSVRGPAHARAARRRAVKSSNALPFKVILRASRSLLFAR